MEQIDRLIDELEHEVRLVKSLTRQQESEADAERRAEDYLDNARGVWDDDVKTQSI